MIDFESERERSDVMRARRGVKSAQRASGAGERGSRGNGHTDLSKDEINRMIAEAAYLRAARRGFAPGGEMDDWLAAEREILGNLSASPLRRRPDGALIGQEMQHRGVLVETPPADATAR
jgi:hypothetical protein